MSDLKTSDRERSQEFEDDLVTHMNAFYLQALKFTQNPTDAQDLLQDSITRALRFHNRYQKGTYFKAWMMTIIRNTFINDYRKKARRPKTVEWSGFDPTPAESPDPDMGYFPGELKSRHILEYLNEDIREAVEALPEGHRRTVIMADLQSMSYREIADEMDCPLGTVMSRLHRGRRLLREALAGYQQEVAYS